jgi:tetratricopeptide (TPR) repeat protein
VELAKRGRDDEALSSVDKAITLKGDEVNPYLLRSELREKKGDTPGAIADLTRSLELDPNYKAPRSNRALLYQELGKYDLSLADYDKLLTLEPGDAYYAQRRADVMEKMASGPAAKPAAPPPNVKADEPAPEVKKQEPVQAGETDCRYYLAASNTTISPCAPTDPNNLHGPGSALVRRVYSADAIA